MAFYFRCQTTEKRTQNATVTACQVGAFVFIGFIYFEVIINSHFDDPPAGGIEEKSHFL